MQSPHTRIDVFETVLGGAAETLLAEGIADLAITPSAPAGVSIEPLARMRFVAVAHPDHPLHRFERPLTVRDLRKHRHLVVRESGSRRTSADSAGPGTLALAQIIRDEVAQEWRSPHDDREKP